MVCEHCFGQSLKKGQIKSQYKSTAFFDVNVWLGKSHDFDSLSNMEVSVANVLSLNLLLCGWMPVVVLVIEIGDRSMAGQYYSILDQIGRVKKQKEPTAMICNDNCNNNNNYTKNHNKNNSLQPTARKDITAQIQQRHQQNVINIFIHVRFGDIFCF